MPYSLYPHFTGDPYAKSFEFLDTVLLAAPEQTSFRYEDIIKESDLPQIEKDIAKHINSHFRNLIQRDLKYIEPLPNDIWKQRLTSLGRSVKKAGGHFAYLEKQENNAAADAERQKRKDIIDINTGDIIEGENMPRSLRQIAQDLLGAIKYLHEVAPDEIPNSQLIELGILIDQLSNLMNGSDDQIGEGLIELTQKLNKLMQLVAYEHPIILEMRASSAELMSVVN